MEFFCEKKTHAAQTDPKQLAPAITKFHSKLLRVHKRGAYQTKDIANMDQTPLQSVLDDRKTYAAKGSSEVWCVPGSSGLDMRQCSVQLTIFADGVPCVRSLVIFRAKGLRITHKKQEAWDCRVQVSFQPKAWCGESMMKKWISEQWGNIFINSRTTGSTGKILVADVHRAQQTDGFKALLKKKNTELVNNPPSCTS